MKKFFQGGGGGGGTTSVEISTIQNSPSQGAYQAGHGVNLLQMPTAGYMSAASASSGSSPRTPQYTTPTQQYFDIHRSGTISPAPSSSTMMLGSGVLAPVQNMAVSPGASNVLPVNTSSTTDVQSHIVERNELHKGLKSLESLLITFDEYRDLKNKLAKCEKRLAKNLGELSKSKMLEETPSQTLQASAQIFDSITDTTSKHARLIQREYEALNEHCAKYFKKVAKEERGHDELLDTLDSKIKKAHASHEKNSKKSGKIAMESHDKYIQTVQALTLDISKIKVNHNAMIGQKTFIMSLVLASTLGGIADSEFKALCENVRKSGQHIGKLNEWLNFASTEGMTRIQPIDLTEEAMGWAQVMAIKEAEIRDEMIKQEQTRYAQLEQTQAVMKAQQMGWTPPPSHQQSRQIDVSSPQISRDEPMAMKSLPNNLPRLDGDGQLMDYIKAERPIMPRAVSRANSQLASLVLKEMEKKPEVVQPSSKMVETGPKIEEETLHSVQSSLADGTIIDRGEGETAKMESEQQSKPSSPTKSIDSACRDGSDALSSLTTSVSKASASAASDDSSLNVTDSSNSSRKSIGPSTPREEEPTQITMIKGAFESVGGILKKSDLIIEEAEIKVERPHDRYVDTAVMPRRTIAADRLLVQQSDDIKERTRQSSLWEHEKEREKQIEREVELQRRLMEAENRLRKMDSIPKYRQAEGSRPRYSESSKSVNGREEIPAQRYEPERYAPTLGSSRLSSAGVNRTLSTDSERSFVARMKAKYQEEKSSTLDFNSNRPISTVKPSISYAGYAAETYNPSSSQQSRYGSPPRQLEEHRGVHSATCNCWSCSARHYSSSGGTISKNTFNQSASPQPAAPPPIPRRHPAIMTQPPNHRRQSMPPVRDEGSNLSAPPPPSREVYARRSFEAEPDRRVMFANDYQTIR